MFKDVTTVGQEMAKVRLKPAFAISFFVYKGKDVIKMC